MVDRGFGIQIEESYGESVAKSAFEPDWWSEAETVDFKLNDEPVTKSGSSRMNKRARAGVSKPTGTTNAEADLQRLGHYFYGFLDNYVYTAGATSSAPNTHEFYGGEGKELPSFRGLAVFDMLKKYIYGMLEDGLKLECSDDSLTVESSWIYKTEKAGIIGSAGETFERPDELDNDYFIMFYDIALKLNNSALDGVSTAFTFEGKNNHNVDSTIGFGSRHPQKRAVAGKREIDLSLTTTLTSETVRSILNAEYGEVGALEPSSCKILQVPLEVDVALCENANISCKILFPKCTVKAEYDMSGSDNIEVTMKLATLGSGSVTLKDGTTSVTTDMYVKLVNNQPELEAAE